MLEPNIYEHLDYRSFLHAFVTFKKQKQPKWTYGQWAQALDLKATTSITMVLNGQRHPGEKLAQSLAAYFKFNSSESHHFFNLIQFAKTDSQSHLKEVLRKELVHRAARGSKRPVDPSVFTVISNWYFLTIRQMAKTPFFKPEASWIVKSLRFPVSEEVAVHAVNTLKKLKLLVTNSDGKTQSSKATITTENDVAREAYKIYHEQVSQLALKAIREIPVEERQFSALTLPMAKSQLPLAKELIQRFLDDFDKLLFCSEAEDVYHLNLQLFPVANMNHEVEIKEIMK